MPVIGWREWVALPELGIPAIKAKIDTGARTSALHAVDLERFTRRGVDWVRFCVHPHQRDVESSVVAEAEVIDERIIRNSGGHSESRPVIAAVALLGAESLTIELTLTNRALMGFRMLLGREAVRHRFLVDPGASYFHREGPGAGKRGAKKRKKRRAPPRPRVEEEEE
ncbi:MAG: ATP-dependent zinc protease [Myxococcales bacterium]|nr:ATP-dependent zinc protease [Myxococcales bacterium]MCB9706069.1 ATP-dependent zinc protease [Myxococcales bacterium]